MLFTPNAGPSSRWLFPFYLKAEFVQYLTAQLQRLLQATFSNAIDRYSFPGLHFIRRLNRKRIILLVSAANSGITENKRYQTNHNNEALLR